MDEREIHIVRDYQNDKMQIYYLDRLGDKRISFEYEKSNGLIVHEKTLDELLQNKILPFIELPLRFGEQFLIILSDEITKQGINTRKVDMQAGKTELLIEQLDFTQKQLVKFIDKSTK